VFGELHLIGISSFLDRHQLFRALWYQIMLHRSSVEAWPGAERVPDVALRLKTGRRLLT